MNKSIKLSFEEISFIEDILYGVLKDKIKIGKKHFSVTLSRKELESLHYKLTT